MATNNNHLQDNPTTDDSEPESDTADHESSYRPISFQSDSDSETEPDNSAQPDPAPAVPIHSNGGLPNPNPNPHSTSNGIATLDLNEEEDGDDEEEEVVETEREREASIMRAFREDENRRNAPLTPESTSRIMDAMRGVNFPGSRAPEWADQVGEDRWLDRLRRLRGETTTSQS